MCLPVDYYIKDSRAVLGLFAHLFSSSFFFLSKRPTLTQVSIKQTWPEYGTKINTTSNVLSAGRANLNAKCMKNLFIQKKKKERNNKLPGWNQMDEMLRWIISLEFKLFVVAGQLVYVCVWACRRPLVNVLMVVRLTIPSRHEFGAFSFNISLSPHVNRATILSYDDR